MAGPSGRPRIIVTGDVLRCVRRNEFYHQLANARWLHGLFETPILEATGIAPELVFSSFSDEVDIPKVYRELGLAADSSGWIQVFDNLPDAVTQRLYGDVDGALVIGFELPPGLTTSLTRLGARVLNVGIHPVRFMDDIFLAIQTPDALLTEGLARHVMSERLAHRAAGLVKAYQAKAPLKRIPAPVAVFAGQMPIDRSLIRDGRLVTADDLKEKIESTFGRFETILLKPHPLATENPVIDRIKAIGLATQVTELDFYELICHPDVAAIVAISSGTCQEAPYFGKEGIHLSHCATPCLWHGDSTGSEGWWSIYDDFLVPDFWRDVLNPIMKVTPADGDRPSPKPNRLRIALREFWGYAGIDPKMLVMQSGVAPNLDRMRIELAALKRIRRLGERMARLPLLGPIVRAAARHLR
jgi:hypothetical protein